MTAFGIAGLVDGFFKGREIRNGWEDRKDQKARQAKLDEFYAAEQGRVAERHEWARGDQGRKVSDYDRARADDEAFRTANQDAIDATEASMAEGATSQPITASTMGAPPRGPTTDAAAALPGAIDATTRRSAAADQFERFFDPNDLGAPPRPVSEGTPAGPRRADVKMGDARGEAIAESRDTRAMPPRTIEDMRAQAIAEARATQTAPAQTQQQANQAVPPMNMPENPRLLTEGPGPGGGMQQLFDQGILPRRYVQDQAASEQERAESQGPQQPSALENFASMVAPPDFQYEWGSEGLPGDAREAVVRATAALGAIPQAVANTTTRFGNGLRGIVNPAVKYVTGGKNGYEFPMQPVGDDEPALGAAPQGQPSKTTPEAPAAPTAPAAGLGPRISNVPANAPADVKQLASVADQTMEQASTPAIEATAAAVAMDEGLGAAGKRPITEKQRTRAADAFMDRYMEVGAPIVIKEYLRRGEIDKAKAFQEFLDQNTTKKGIRHWARASFAATVGDFETFADEIIEGQNVAGYFGDTVKIVKDKSGFTKDEQGNITGAKLILVDEATGNEFEQVFNSPADLVNAGMYFASPEVQFEYAQKQVEAARETALGATKEGKEDQDKMAKAIIEQANKILENSKGLDNVPTKTQEEAEIEAEQMVRRLYSGAPRRAEAEMPGAPEQANQGPPVMYRP